MASGHRWQQIGDEYLRLFVAAYQQDGKIHWPTLVSAIGALSGESALFECVTDLPEAGVVESDRISALMHQGDNPPRSIYGYGQLIAEQAFNVDTHALPSYQDTLAKVGYNLLPGHYPDLDVPISLAPRQTPLFAGPKHRKAVNRIASEHGIDGRDCAFALMTAAMKAVGFASDIGVFEMSNLVLQSAVAGSRFVPLLDLPSNPSECDIAELITQMQSPNIAPPAVAAAAAREQSQPVEDYGYAEDQQRAGFGRRR